VSGDRFTWLLSPAGSGTIRSEHELEEAFALATGTDCWHAAPAIHEKLLAHTKRSLHSHPLVLRLRDFSTGVTAYSRVQIRMALRIEEAFRLAGVPFVFLKSSASRFLAFDDPHHRTGYDIDMGVAHDDLEAASGVAADLGFIAAEWDDATQRYLPASQALVDEAEADHYELAYRVREQAVRGLPPETVHAIRREPLNARLWHDTGREDPSCYITLDIHHGASLDIGLGDALRSTRRVRYQGHALPVPPNGWLAFHLIFKLYWEGVHNYRKGGYQYADLCRLIPRLSATECRRLERHLDYKSLTAGAFYVLRRLPPLGVPLPRALDRLMQRASITPPSGSATDQNDLGDVWPKLWGFR
jgi:hypothetical protein